jgi:hypothetical protein
MNALVTTLLALSVSTTTLPPKSAGAAGDAAPTKVEVGVAGESSDSATRDRADPWFDERFVAGEPSSPVTVILYVALEGARSGDLVIALHQEVCAGRLKGKAKLIIRPILVEGGDEDAARAVTAAADQGKLWPFLVRLYGQDTPLSKSKLRRCASLSGMDGGAFDAAVHNPETDRVIAATRCACKKNRLNDEPCIFANGNKLPSGLTTEQIVRLLEETRP